MVKTDHRLATSTCEIILQMKGPFGNLNDVVGGYQGFLPCALSDLEKEIGLVFTWSALLTIGRRIFGL